MAGDPRTARVLSEATLVIQGRDEGTLGVMCDERGCWLVRSGFPSRLVCSVPVMDAARLAGLVADHRWLELYQYDPEFLPWYCPECGTLYPRDQWRAFDVFEEDGWHDQVRGACPKGHERMLED